MSTKRVPTTDEALALARYWAGDEQPGDAAIAASYAAHGPMILTRELAGALARWALVAVPQLLDQAAHEAAWWQARAGWQADLEMAVMRARRAEAELTRWTPVREAAEVQTDGEGRPGMWRTLCWRTGKAVKRARQGGEL